MKKIYIIIVIAFLSGCTASKFPLTIQTTITFEKLETQADQDRVKAVMDKTIPPANMEISGSPTNPVYTFKGTIKDIETVNRRIKSIRTEGRLKKKDESTSHFYTNPATYEGGYGTLGIVGGISTQITLQITPGSKLFYKDGKNREQELTNSVDSTGKITFPAQIRPNQKYVYARTSKADAERFIKIKTETGEVEEISRKEYNKN